MHWPTTPLFGRNSRFYPLYTACFGLGLAACPGSLDDPSAFLVDDAGADTGSSGDGLAPAPEAGAHPCPMPSDVPTMIFLPTCGFQGCHDPGAKAQGLDLASAGVSARLVHRPSTEVPSQLLADPTNPAQSYLMVKLTSSMPPSGARMPFGGVPLNADQLECVRAWIASQ